MSHKGRASADRVARRLAKALRRALPGARIRLLPFADGGEGTARAVASVLGGSWRRARVAGPLGRPAAARWLWVPERRLSVFDAAEACGLARVPARRRDPMRATSRGLGELVRRALAAGAREIWIGLGGTATVDGGVGALRALGVRFSDGGAPRVDRSGLDSRLRRVRMVLLCDVRSPLLGPTGAARMFGPQKGASPGQVRLLEERLAAFARDVRRETGRDVRRVPGAGAAGGIAAGFDALLGARIEEGARTVGRALGLARAVRRADLVLSGEGRLDAQTLQGKGVAEVCRAARRARRPVALVVGRNALPRRHWRRLGVRAVFEGREGVSEAARWARDLEKSGKGESSEGRGSSRR